MKTELNEAFFEKLLEGVSASLDEDSPSTGKDDPLNIKGILEADKISEALREGGVYAEPFLNLAFQNRHQYVDDILKSLKECGISDFHKEDGENCCVIAVKDQERAKILHRIAAEFFNMPCYTLGDDFESQIEIRSLELN